jgi:hypothetical protein
MARIRTVKPELFRHEALYEAEVKTNLPLRLAYIGLFTACDREGRFKWKPRALKLDVLPYDQIDFSRVLDALVTHGFIVKYQFEDDEFGCIPTWSQHQVINNRESTSLLPSLEESTTCTHEARVVDASITPLVRTQGEEEGKGKEGKWKRNKENAVASRPEDVSQQVWDDWVALRKRKNTTISETAIDGARDEAAKIGWTLQQFLIEWCTRGSQGLKAEWIKPDQQSMSKTGLMNKKVISGLTRGLIGGDSNVRLLGN